MEIQRWQNVVVSELMEEHIYWSKRANGPENYVSELQDILFSLVHKTWGEELEDLGLRSNPDT